MTEPLEQNPPPSRELPKALTGIRGLDEISGGGLPRGRPTLVCGSAGCGKTLLAMEFLIRGAAELDEPGVFVSFEESALELTQNVRSLGFDLDQLESDGKILVEAIQVDRSQIEETGEYDLEGLFIRLGLAIDSIGARRVVLDTIENLFGGLSDDSILRSELRRLFGWLKERGMTTVITGERGEGQLTRHGLEEYVADCVILLDHRVSGQLSTRRIRIVKYRGTVHGTNEYPFLIDETGISVLPVTSIGLDHPVSTERISSGIPRLDSMLGGNGYFRGSSIMVSGAAGTGKTSIAVAFVAAACARGERCLYLSFEESAPQIVRNMRSIGIDLGPCIAQDSLRIESARPSLYGLESHLVAIHKLVHDYRPRAVVIDPVSSFTAAGAASEVQAMLLRLIDFLKSEGITALLVSLTGAASESSEIEVSSLIDTWILLRNLEAGGERNRGLYVLKSRGMPHSNQIREFRLTDHGIDLLDVYVGSEGVLTGSLRASQEARERALEAARQRNVESRQRELSRRRVALEAQIASLRADAEAIEEEARRIALEDADLEQTAVGERENMAKRRGADPSIASSVADIEPFS